MVYAHVESFRPSALQSDQSLERQGKLRDLTRTSITLLICMHGYDMQNNSRTPRGEDDPLSRATWHFVPADVPAFFLSLTGARHLAVGVEVTC